MIAAIDVSALSPKLQHRVPETLLEKTWGAQLLVCIMKDSTSTSKVTTQMWVPLTLRSLFCQVILRLQNFMLWLNLFENIVTNWKKLVVVITALRAAEWILF